MKRHFQIISSRCTKGLTSLVALFAMLTSLTAQSPLVIEKVVAKVGTENIFYSDVQELYQYARAKSPAADEELQCQIMEQLIAKKLLVDQAKLDSIFISPIEVQVEVDRRLDYIMQQMGGDEERFYQYYGKTRQEQGELMKEATEEMLVEQRIQGSLIKDVDITPKEVVAFFESIPKDSLPFLPAEVELAEITTKTRISDEVKQAAYDKLQGVRDRIEEGESFQELASIFSDDPGSALNGGDLGWAKRGSYVPEFEAVAFNLEKGELSDILETPFGYHIIELLERRGNNIHVRHILIKPEVTPEDVASTKEYLDSIKQLIISDSITFSQAVRLYSDEDAQSYSNAGRLANPQTGDTFWETGQLPYQIYFAIESLDVDGVSDIIEMEERGDKIFKIVQLQSKTKPHRASLETDFAKIKPLLRRVRKMSISMIGWTKRFYLPI